MQLLVVTSLLLSAVLVNGRALGASYITKRQLLDSYDYIVVGGGTGGIAVGARLSERPNINVLVIEAGPVDDDDEIITIPGKVGQGSGSKYDWNYRSVVQTQGNGRQVNIPAGKLVGGSSALNGMCYDRGAAADYNAWADLGNPGWTWDEILPYFKRNERFTPPPKEQAERLNITYDLSAHGLDGAIHSSYPSYILDTNRPWRQALDSMGIPQELDGHNGRALNMFWAPNSIDPTSVTRSYGKTGYYLPATKRPNFHILTSTVVQKLLHKTNPDGSVTVTSIQYAGGTIKAKREVIVSSGAIGTPKLLQHSGFGPAPLLTKHSIPIAVPLPGVGTNYQDHPFESVRFTLRNGPPFTLPVNAEALYRTNKTGPWTVAGPTFYAFLPLSTITPRYLTILDSFLAQSPSAHLPPNSDPTVIAGYAAQQKVLHKHLSSPDMAATEFINGGLSSVTLSHQHEFSRGLIEINSADTSLPPTIDFRYGTNPADLDVLVESVRWIRKAFATPIMQKFQPTENSPGAAVTTDEGIASYMRSQMSTMYHSCCTAPMQPRELGGVVDPRLRVYGTTNLRVVDASVIPLIPGTHIQSTVYMIAEKAVDLLLEDFESFN